MHLRSSERDVFEHAQPFVVLLLTLKLFDLIVEILRSDLRLLTRQQPFGALQPYVLALCVEFASWPRTRSASAASWMSDFSKSTASSIASRPPTILYNNGSTCAARMLTPRHLMHEYTRWSFFASLLRGDDRTGRT